LTCVKKLDAVLFQVDHNHLIHFFSFLAVARKEF
jgi:hypothetical protein